MHVSPGKHGSSLLRPDPSPGGNYCAFGSYWLTWTRNESSSLRPHPCLRRRALPLPVLGRRTVLKDEIARPVRSHALTVVDASVVRRRRWRRFRTPVRLAGLRRYGRCHRRRSWTSSHTLRSTRGFSDDNDKRETEPRRIWRRQMLVPRAALRASSRRSEIVGCPAAWMCTTWLERARSKTVPVTVTISVDDICAVTGAGSALAGGVALLLPRGARSETCEQSDERDGLHHRGPPT